jgi:ATP-dependent Clp protease protease subunit
MDMKSDRYSDTYVKLSPARMIFISENITKEVASSFSAMLSYYEQQSKTEDVYVYINTNGGDSAALVHMYDVMQMVKPDIHTVCIGKAYSAGAVLLAAGAKGKRSAFKHSSVMLHGIQIMFPPITEIDQSNSNNYFNFVKSHNDTIMEILSKHTGKDVKTLKSDCSRDLYLSAKDCLDYGIIDNII